MIWFQNIYSPNISLLLNEDSVCWPITVIGHVDYQLSFSLCQINFAMFLSLSHLRRPPSPPCTPCPWVGEHQLHGFVGYFCFSIIPCPSRRVQLKTARGVWVVYTGGKRQTEPQCGVWWGLGRCGYSHSPNPVLHWTYYCAATNSTSRWCS